MQGQSPRLHKGLQTSFQSGFNRSQASSSSMYPITSMRNIASNSGPLPLKSAFCHCSQYFEVQFSEGGVSLTKYADTGVVWEATSIDLKPACVMILYTACRGTPEFPGRTVTLESCKGEVVHGVAYLLAGSPEEQQKALKVLSDILRISIWLLFPYWMSCNYWEKSPKSCKCIQVA